MPSVMVDLSANTALLYLYCGGNGLHPLIFLPIRHCGNWNANNGLSALNLSANTALLELTCFGNALTTLDVSSNTALTFIQCGANQLSSLNIANGNNSNLTEFNSVGNPSLTCIQVDNVGYMNANWGWAKDAGSTFSTTCPLVCTVNIPDANFKAALLANPAINNQQQWWNWMLGSGCLYRRYRCKWSEHHWFNWYRGLHRYQPVACVQQPIDFHQHYRITALTNFNCQNNQLTNVRRIIQYGAHGFALQWQTSWEGCWIFPIIRPLWSWRQVITTWPVLILNGPTNLTTASWSWTRSAASIYLQTPIYSYLAINDNQLTTLDVSALYQLNSQLYAQTNALLASINIQNGNNTNLTNFNVTNSPLLTCIRVDDVTLPIITHRGVKTRRQPIVSPACSPHQVPRSILMVWSPYQLYIYICKAQ